MTFCIITHVNHFKEGNKYYAYAPYVREMNLWFKYIDKVIIVAPANKPDKTVLDIPYEHNNLEIRHVPPFDLTSFKNILKTFVVLPSIIYSIYKAMKDSDHIHLRCAGNMALLGCFVQILFPKKKKTAKYAGNWDPRAKEPLTVTLQKKILNNSFLTRNMQVMVYGEWKNSSKNIKSFFTATYTDKELQKAITEEALTTDDRFNINKDRLTTFLYVGTLTSRKRPLYAIDLVKKLHQEGYNVHLSFIGEGEERKTIEEYITKHQLSDIISLKGNKTKEEVAQLFKKSEFILLPSKIEGWPKAVAEGMFWGCVPISTPISCVPYMLDQGNRGILLTLNLDNDSKQIANLINNNKRYQNMSELAKKWSREYTMEKFENELVKLLQ